MAEKSLKQKKKFSFGRFLYDAGSLVLGNGLYALAVALFAVPTGLVLGGVTGISVSINKLLPFLKISYMVLALNILLLIIGMFILGRRFFVTTVAATFIYPAMLELCTQLLNRFPKITEYFSALYDDYFVCAMLAGIMMGVGLGIVVRIGASTGGSDVLPLIMNKLVGLPVGIGMIIFDGIIVASQIPFSNLLQVAYGLLTIVGMSIILDRTIIMGKGKVQMEIISEHADEIRKEILTSTKRGGGGVTMVEARKGYSGEKNEIIMSVVYSRELIYYKKLILSIDPQAFIIINRVSEVNGNGFSFSKDDKHLDKEDVE